MGPIAVWSVKGGVGVTSVAAMLAISQAESAHETLLVDLCGDLPALLGIPEPTGPGLVDWCALATPTADGLARIEVDIQVGLRLLPLGEGGLPATAPALVDALRQSTRRVIIDCGLVRTTGLRRHIVLESPERLLVLRACYLNLKHTQNETTTATGVVLLKEPRRSLGRADVEAVAGAPVVAELAVDHSVARWVDSGLLASRLPRSLLHTLDAAVSNATA